MEAIPVLHLCRWTRWTEATPCYQGTVFVQSRECVICGRIDKRKVWNGEQSNPGTINQALASVRARAQGVG